jgi:hypothetical protein
MKQLLKDALAEGHLQGISQEEIDSLSEGEAMVATQLALWMYGNRLEGETEFDGSNFNGTGEDGSCDRNATEQDKEAWRRMEHIASYLAGLKETAGDSTLSNRPSQAHKEATIAPPRIPRISPAKMRASEYRQSR